MARLLEKHSRQILIPEIGIDGQTSIQKSSILIVGAGGLGIPASQYLAASGVGKLGLVDHDIIERSNLGRQISYSENHIGKKKTEVLCEKLSRQHPDVQFLTYDVEFNSNNSEEISKEYQLILNCTDNIKARYVINEVAHKLQIPWVNMAVTQMEGQISTFLPNNGCFACLFPQQHHEEKATACGTQNQNCNSLGILGPLCGMFGSWGATLALNLLLQLEPKENIFYHFDSRNNSLKNYSWKKNNSCQVCSSNTVQKQNIKIKNPNSLSITMEELNALLESEKNIAFIDLNSSPTSSVFKNSFKMNLDDFFSHNLEDPPFLQVLDKKFHYIATCEFGVKSRIAAQTLVQEGFVARYLEPVRK